MAGSWFNIDKTISKLNISEDELDHMIKLNHIQYSSKTDKFNIDSVLEKRTMTIGLDKLINDDLKEILLNKMNAQSSFIKFLFSQMQKGNTFTANQCCTIGQNDFNLMSYEALSSYAIAKGKYDSSQSWLEKKINNLSERIEIKQKELDNLIQSGKYKKFNPIFVKGKRNN